MLEILYDVFQQQTDPLKRYLVAETSYLLDIEGGYGRNARAKIQRKNRRIY